MGHFNKSVVIIVILLGLLSSIVQGQNYRDQKKLIRLKPNNIMVFGQVLTPAGDHISGATVSLFDPQGAKIIESIPVDDLGEYLFILEKGKSLGLIIEKEGFFPFYSPIEVPLDLEEEWENPIQLPDGLKNRFELLYSPKSASPGNPEILDELLNTLFTFNSLLVWIPDEQDSIFNRRVSNIKSSFLDAGIDSYRLSTGDLPGNLDQFIQLQLTSDYSLEDTEEELVQEELEPAMEVNPDKWTLQFIASKNELEEADLKGISDYRLFKGKDGYFRYTYGIYESKEGADAGKAYLRTKGFNQPFAKKIQDLQKL